MTHHASKGRATSTSSTMTIKTKNSMVRFVRLLFRVIVPVALLGTKVLAHLHGGIALDAMGVLQQPFWHIDHHLLVFVLDPPALSSSSGR
jgi:hypothetical protein